MWDRTLLRLSVLALVGSILGFGAEMLHLRAGVWVLPGEAGLPWWIVPVYFSGLLTIGLLFLVIERRGGRRLSVSRVTLLLEVLLLLALFICPVLLHRHELLLTAVAAACLVARLLLFRAPGDLKVAILAMVADLAVESSLLASSLFAYSNARWLPVPLWLAPLWGAVGLGLRRLFLFATSDRIHYP